MGLCKFSFQLPAIRMLSLRESAFFAIGWIALTIVAHLSRAGQTTHNIKFISADSNAARGLLPKTLTTEILTEGFGLAEGPLWDSKN